jgi:ribose transport system permease protein
MKGTSSPSKLVRILQNYGTLIALAILVIIFTIARPGVFLTVKNGLEIAQQIAMTAIVAIGLTFPLAMKNFDLSVGYVASVAGVFLVRLFGLGIPELPAILITIAVVGGVSGFINGFLVSFIKIPSLVVTVSTGFVFLGVSFILTGGETLHYGIPESFAYWGNGYLGIFPVTVVITIIIAALCIVVMELTSFGRYAYSIGNNEEASVYAGVNVRLLKLAGFIVSACLAAVAGILIASKTNSGAPTGAVGYLMNGLAAALIGTSIYRKEEGNVIGAILGAIIIGIVYNGMTMLGSPYYLLQVVTGCIFIATLALSGIKK